MICTLCNEPLIMKGKIRPNIATFECGHHFHLGCVLKHSKMKMTNDCFKCSPGNSSFLPNLGDDRIVAMESLIQARQSNNKETTGGWFSSFKSSASLQSMVNMGSSLSTIKLKGFLPEDFIEKGITWNKVKSVYTIDSLLNFGFRWHHMIVMGFKPKDFKSLSWDQMNITLNLTATDMLQTSMNIRDLGALQLEPYQLHEMGFTWNDFVKMGGNASTMKLLSTDLDDFKTYFEPSNQELFDAGFTEEKTLKSYKNVKVIQPKKVKRGGMVF